MDFITNVIAAELIEKMDELLLDHAKSKKYERAGKRLIEDGG